jgi:hypothetical protein
MKIKRPFNFTIGIFCLLCFILTVVLRRDSFDIALTAVTAVGNLAFGLME